MLRGDCYELVGAPPQNAADAALVGNVLAVDLPQDGAGLQALSAASTGRRR